MASSRRKGLVLKITREVMNIAAELRRQGFLPSSVCPVTQALKAKGFKDVSTEYSTTSFTKRTKWYEASLPKRAQAFIKAFDSATQLGKINEAALAQLKPFQFSIYPKAV